MNGRVNFLLFQKHAGTNRARIVPQARPLLKPAFCENWQTEYRAG